MKVTNTQKSSLPNYFTIFYHYVCLGVIYIYSTHTMEILSTGGYCLSPPNSAFSDVMLVA